jgi:hypothetical protein
MSGFHLHVVGASFCDCRRRMSATDPRLCPDWQKTVASCVQVPLLGFLLKPIDLVCREHGSLAEAFSVVGPDGEEKQTKE